MQWALLPPLVMTNPQVAVAGILEPAYDVAGDSFDYALNDDDLQLAIVDAMGHGLDAAVLATVAIAAYRHASRVNVDLPDFYYAAMDRAIAGQFDEEHFVTVMAHLDVGSGRLRWVNAGHPHLLLLRGRRVVGALDIPTTLPIGFGGADPQVSEVTLEPGDRVLFFTDGITEEHLAGGDLFGERRLIDLLEKVAPPNVSVISFDSSSRREVARSLPTGPQTQAYGSEVAYRSLKSTVPPERRRTRAERPPANRDCQSGTRGSRPRLSLADAAAMRSKEGWFGTRGPPGVHPRRIALALAHDHVRPRSPPPSRRSP